MAQIGQELNNTVLKNSINLKAYYRMESGALLVDSSGNGNTLTNVNTVGNATGVFGSCGDFGVPANNKQLSTGSTLSYGGGAYSLSIWFNSPNATLGTTHPGFIGALDNVSQTAIGICLGATGVFASRLRQGIAFDDTSQIAISANTWYMATLTYDGTTLKLYLNGAFRTSVSSTGNGSSAVTASCYIGSYTDYTGGLMDDALFYAGVLTPDQIKELYEGRTLGEGWPQTNLQGLYHMSSTTDSSGNNYTLTNNGTVTFPAGKFNLAADFGSTNTTKYFQVAQNFGITTGVNATFAFWYKCSAEPGNNVYYRLFEHAGGATDRFFNLSYNNNAGTKRLHCNASGTAATYDVTLGTTGWHYIVAVRDTVSRIYLDGNQVATNSLGTSQPGIAAALSIGADIGAGAGAYTNGLIDEFQVFNVAKSADWVRKQYALGVGKFY